MDTNTKSVVNGKNEGREVVIVFILSIRKTQKKDYRGNHAVGGADFDPIIMLYDVNEEHQDDSCFVILSGGILNQELSPPPNQLPFPVTC